MQCGTVVQDVLLMRSPSQVDLDKEAAGIYSRNISPLPISLVIKGVEGVDKQTDKQIINQPTNQTVNRSINQQGNVLFNDALNTFYLRLYAVGNMVKHYSDSEREETTHMNKTRKKEEKRKERKNLFRLLIINIEYL